MTGMENVPDNMPVSKAEVMQGQVFFNFLFI